jgi:hypothetical protein
MSVVSCQLLKRVLFVNYRWLEASCEGETDLLQSAVEGWVIKKIIAALRQLERNHRVD